MVFLNFNLLCTKLTTIELVSFSLCTGSVFGSLMTSVARNFSAVFLLFKLSAVKFVCSYDGFFDSFCFLKRVFSLVLVLVCFLANFFFSLEDMLKRFCKNNV